MIQSMTGYAAVSADTARGALALELSSVNSRFLDLQFRVHEELRALEPMLRELISARVARGKIDCRLSFSEAEAVQLGARVNAEALARLKQLSDEVVSALPQAAPLRIADVLRWPGVVAAPRIDEDETRAVVAALCARALDELVAARSREGAKLAAALAERAAAMRRKVDEAAPHVPESLAAYQAKLAERLKDILGSVDDARGGAGQRLFASLV